MVKEIVVLGSTGSIGTQALDIARTHSIAIRALSAYQNIELLASQAREFNPQFVCIFDESLFIPLKAELSDTDITVLTGIDGLCEVSAIKNAMVINSVVGMVGLLPTISAIKAGNDIALANKETLVTGGEIVMKLAKENNVRIIPVDSEHSAIFQCLLGNNRKDLSKIILTASGGPFFNYTTEQLQKVTKAQALRHPNWEMGAKITIDSATLMNKGLEFIEAVRLFDVTADEIEVIVHRQSIIHSAVEYKDCSIIAHLGTADMRIPIQYALTFPERINCPAKKLSLTDISSLTFEKPDEDVFICLATAKEAVRLGGNAPTIINSANEEAVRLFLEDKISFSKIGELVYQSLNKIDKTKCVNIDIILETEKITREFVRSSIK